MFTMNEECSAVFICCVENNESDEKTAPEEEGDSPEPAYLLIIVHDQAEILKILDDEGTYAAFDPEVEKELREDLLVLPAQNKDRQTIILRDEAAGMIAEQMDCFLHYVEEHGDGEDPSSPPTKTFNA